MNGRSVWKTWDDQRIRNLMLQARIQYLEKRPGEAARCARQALDLMLRGLHFGKNLCILSGGTSPETQQSRRVLSVYGRQKESTCIFQPDTERAAL